MNHFPPIAEDLSDLEEQMRRERHPLREQRLHLLVLIRRGEVSWQTEAARYLAVHRNTAGGWLKTYRQGGLEALLHVGEAGHPTG